MGGAQILPDFFRLHHGGATVGKRGFLALLRSKAAEFLDGVAKPFGLPRRALDGRAMLRDGGLAHPALGPKPRDLGSVFIGSAKGIEQRAVRRRIDESAVVMLAVNLHQGRT